MKLTFSTQTAPSDIYPSLLMRSAHNKVLQPENQEGTKLPQAGNAHILTLTYMCAPLAP